MPQLGEPARVTSMLAARRSRAFAALAGQWSASPVDAVSLIDPLGGVHLPPGLFAHLDPRWAAAREVLDHVGILRAGHSHGGLYFVADPDLYLHPPPWHVRRRCVDARLAALLAALPASVAPASLSVPERLLVIAVADLLRTDSCTILWNEMARATSEEARRAALNDSAPMIDFCWRTILAVLPPLPGARQRQPGDLSLRPSRTTPPLGAEGPLRADAEPHWVRSRRASDDTFSAWASAYALADHPDPIPSRCWAFGNAFGGIDLGFLLAAALAGRGIDVVPSVCSLGWRGSRADGGQFVLWPSGPPPRLAFFCDDSVTTGTTIDRFTALCRAHYPATEVRPFVLTFDLGPMEDGDPTSGRRFADAWCATARAPWSKSGFHRPAVLQTSSDLILSMLSSSDERLRWLAATQADTLHALNRAARSADRARE